MAIPQTVTVEIFADTSAFVAAVEKWTAQLPRLRQILANVDVKVAGLEGRYYVRAGLDPAYATPAALDTLVGRIMSGRESRILGLLDRDTRALVAAAAIRGWSTSYPATDPGDALVWCRFLSGQRVWVTAGAA